jgi:hypothetical protein
MAATACSSDGRNPEKLDSVVLERWVTYLEGTKEHPYLRRWDDLVRRNAPGEELRKEADAFQAFALSVIREKRDLDARRALLKSPRRSCGKIFTSPAPGPISHTVLHWACFTSAKSISIPRWNAR